MPRMIFSLTEADQEALEDLRVARGARSQAEVLRALIRENTADDFVTLGVVKAPPPTKTVEITPLPASAPTVIKGVREPARARPFKSRLKGEWKAP